MANLLFLPHRMPYPPDKGDKVRSYHLLRHLGQRHRVFVGTFVDDPADAQHLPALGAMCAGLHAEPLDPLRARLASAPALLAGDSLGEHYYRSRRLARWVRQTVQHEGIDLVLAFSSTMAPYAMAERDRSAVPFLLDMVDVDSAKWRVYAEHRSWPLSWVYRREARTLLALERKAASASECTWLATEAEAALLAEQAPEVASRLQAMPNGVDAGFFAPQADRLSPFTADELPLVFTGAMDYWPNVDAVCWFAEAMLPALRQRHPGLRLHIVGRNPDAAVRALAGEAVVVTGTVPDVRPWLQHAAAVVAPLRLARGIQNKVLEAMAMGRAVVAAAPCVRAIGAVEGAELLAAESATDYIAAIDSLLADAPRRAAIGAAARARVLADHTWPAQLGRLDRQIDRVLTTHARPPVPAAAARPEVLA